jgi:hypothetical protein
VSQEHGSATHDEQPASHVEQRPSATANLVPSGARSKYSYCMGMNLHAPHLRNIQDCTCALHTVEGEDFTTRKPVADLSAPRSGPRYDPQQLLRQSRYASDPLVPVNTMGTSVSRESTSRARRARLALPPPSRPYEMDASSSTSSALWASQRHLPTDATDNSSYLVEEANLHYDAPAAAYQHCCHRHPHLVPFRRQAPPQP